ncbi:MAG TPA: hypothetical protein VJ723_01920 [Candidatus Angelobacter sp.]|nr:hypothetical protein [Candidatus Angelobacter sp.]
MAENEKFEEFMRRQQEPIHSANWNEERNEWLRRLDDLYSCIGSFLSKYEQIKTEYRDIRLEEEYVGSYTTKQMVLKIGRQTVNIVPIGTVLIGSKGRVDVVGPIGRTQIVLVNSKAKSPLDLIRFDISIGDKPRAAAKEVPQSIQWAWKIVSRPPERRFEELTRETFYKVLMDVTGG